LSRISPAQTKSSREKLPFVPDRTRVIPLFSFLKIPEIAFATALAFSMAPINNHSAFLQKEIAVVPLVVVKTNFFFPTDLDVNCVGEFPRSKPFSFSPFLSPVKTS